MGQRTCSVEGCSKPRVYANGWCGMHYQRWQRHGSLDNPRQQCAVEGCTKAVRGRGLCGTHYARWRTHGDPLIRKNLVGESEETRFWDKVNREGPVPDIGRCWLWEGAKTATGYGHLRSDGRAKKAHRVSYELFVEPIPEGMEIDHICRNRSCVNPLHLRAVNHQAQASNTVQFNSTKTHCPRGHEYNDYRQSGARRCTRCERILAAERA